jgi:uncharacterized protein YndB with AHSA1/START domain
MSSENNNPPSPTADREVINTRLISAPPSALFAAFRDPQRLAQWWGPNGFTNTIEHFDFTPGGQWRYTMHAPDGANYHNESRFDAIAEPELIDLRHLGPMHSFQLTITFTAEAGGTRLKWRMRFDTSEELAPLHKFLADANDQNIDRLAAHLSQAK